MVFYHVYTDSISNGPKGHGWYFQNKTNLKHSPRSHTDAHTVLERCTLCVICSPGMSCGGSRLGWRAVWLPNSGRACGLPAASALWGTLGTGLASAEIAALVPCQHGLIWLPSLQGCGPQGAGMLLSPTAGSGEKTEIGLCGEKSLRYFLN